MKSKWVRGWTCAIVTMTASTALAQLGGGVAEAEGGRLEPPTAQFRPEESSEVGPIFASVILIALAAGVNLIPTKRGHQD
ncbi:MAG: hypothetical protein AB7K52_13175 [Phycisphaerales bacterium]